MQSFSCYKLLAARRRVILRNGERLETSLASGAARWTRSKGSKYMILDGTLGTIIVTKEHLLAGTLSLAGQRILDFLGDPSTDYVQIRDVDVYRKRCRTLATKLPHAVVRKMKIRMAILKGDKHEAPEKRNNAHSLKAQYDGFLVVEDFEVRGKLHAKGAPDVVAFLEHESGHFVPVTEATVAYAGHSAGDFQARLVIVNKSAIEFIQMSPNQQKPEDVINALRELIKD